MGQLPKVDPGLIADGVWFTYAADIRCRIRSIHSPVVRDALTRLQIIAAETGDTGNLKLIEHVGGLVLAEWVNLEDEHGQLIPWSEEKAQEVLNDPQYVEFQLWVNLCASRIESYRPSAAVVGN